MYGMPGGHPVASWSGALRGGRLRTSAGLRCAGERVVLDPRQPKVDIVARVAGQLAPEAEAVRDLEANLVPVPPVIAAQDLADARVVKVGGVPDAALGGARIEAHLEHRARAVGPVGLAAVPDAVVADQQRAGRAGHRFLPDEVLVARDREFVDSPQVA